MSRDRTDIYYWKCDRAAAFHGTSDYLLDQGALQAKLAAALVRVLAKLILLPVMLIGEALPHFPGLRWLNDTTAAGNLHQLPILLAGAVIFAAGLWLTCRCAAARYEKVDL